MMMTAIAERTSTTKVLESLMIAVFAPNPLDTSSPKFITVKEREIINARANPARKKGAETDTSIQIAFAELPAVYFSISEVSPSLRTIPEVIEEKRVEIAMPESTILSGVIPFLPINATR